jgi:cellulose synthase/poly-beta-1,6-N-acetylglucosamine synthase-like glycosyltransferase
MAWDPFNVSEDADLGVRLARNGYRCQVLHSTTYEEAPRRFRGWLGQRTRWLKGYVQTWLVHMRSPLALWRELGGRGFLTFQVVVGGTVLSALVHP